MNSLKGISPEEILRAKELMGGLDYDDDQKTQIDESPSGIQNETIEIPEEKKENPPKEEKKTIQMEIPKVDQNPQINIQEKDAVFEVHWKNLPTKLLPSKGLFYPENTRMAIRPCDVKEIRHFSTIDEDDSLDIERKLSFILERCLRIDFPNQGVVSYKDLKQEDRFYIIMAIRDLTFLRGENSLILRPKKTCKATPECPFKDGFELRSGNLSSYELEDEILKRYSPEKRCFVFTFRDTGKSFEVFVPTIGVTHEISNFASTCSSREIEIEDGFLDIAPFIMPEWRGLNFENILGFMKEKYNQWGKKEFSLLYQISERIKIGTKTEAKQQCPVCGEGEVTADITFPGGIRSLFLISDIFRELL